MANKNSYWPVYKNLEQEVLKLTHCIQFTDEQLGVYSMDIAKLIVNCAIEAESLAKKLYDMAGGAEVKNIKKKHFDHICLKFLDEKWHLRKKEIYISGMNFYFSDDNNKLRPLDLFDTCIDRCKECLNFGNNERKGPANWNKAYQQLKHNSRDNFDLNATIKWLIDALGALFILNLYYRDLSSSEYKFYLNNGHFDDRVGSEVFSVSWISALDFSHSMTMNDSAINWGNNSDLNKFMYVLKLSDNDFTNIHRNVCLDYDETWQNVAKHSAFVGYLKSLDEKKSSKPLEQHCLDFGGEALLNS